LVAPSFDFQLPSSFLLAAGGSEQAYINNMPATAANMGANFFMTDQDFLERLTPLLNLIIG
jgi:hypothetical protein